MENFNDLNANIDTELSSEYFNQIDRIITGRKFMFKNKNFNIYVSERYSL